MMLFYHGLSVLMFARWLTVSTPLSTSGWQAALYGTGRVYELQQVQLQLHHYDITGPFYQSAWDRHGQAAGGWYTADRRDLYTWTCRPRAWRGAGRTLCNFSFVNRLETEWKPVVRELCQFPHGGYHHWCCERGVNQSQWAFDGRVHGRFTEVVSVCCMNPDSRAVTSGPGSSWCEGEHQSSAVLPRQGTEETTIVMGLIWSVVQTYKYQMLSQMVPGVVTGHVILATGLTNLINGEGVTSNQSSVTWITSRINRIMPRSWTNLNRSIASKTLVWTFLFDWKFTDYEPNLATSKFRFVCACKVLENTSE